MAASIKLKLKKLFERLPGRKISTSLERQLERVAEINRKYAKPTVEMTPMVKVSLFCLRFYLLFLVLVLFYKFTTMV